MQEKAPEYFIAEDPRLPEYGRHILKMSAPTAFIKVLLITNDEDALPQVHEGFTAKRYRHRLLSYVLIDIPFSIEGHFAISLPEEMILMQLDDAFEWFKGYLDWEHDSSRGLENIFRNILPPQ